MTLSILMNVLVKDSITNTSASYRNFAWWLTLYGSEPGVGVEAGGPAKLYTSL